MDPISAIANAAGDLFSAVGGIWTSSNERKIAKTNLLITEEMTEQELIRYREAMKNGNTLLASQLLAQAQSRVDSKSNMNMLIVGGLILMVIVVIVSKSLKK